MLLVLIAGAFAAPREEVDINEAHVKVDEAQFFDPMMMMMNPMMNPMMMNPMMMNPNQMMNSNQMMNPMMMNPSYNQYDNQQYGIDYSKINEIERLKRNYILF